MRGCKTGIKAIGVEWNESGIKWTLQVIRADSTKKNQGKQEEEEEILLETKQHDSMALRSEKAAK